MTSRIAPFHPILRPILCEVFPHKLQFHFFRPANSPRRLLLAPVHAIRPVPLGNIRFSTRSGRERMSSGMGQGGRASASKSLIEDEADLSDWVSDLKSSSFKKTRVYSDSEDDGDRRSGGFGGRGGGAGKRRREGELDKDSDFSDRLGGGGRGGRGGRFSGGRGGGNEFGGSLRGGRGGERDSGRFSRGGGSSFGGRGGGRDAGKFSRGGSSSFGGRGEEREFGRSGGSSYGGRGEGRETSKFSRGGGSSFGGRGGGRDSGKFSRGGRFGGVSDERRERNNDYVSRGSGEWKEKRQGERGSGTPYGNRGGRSGERGGLATKGGGRGMERRGFVITDDEDVDEEDNEEEGNDKGYTSFKELIDSDEADEDDDDEDEEKEDDEVEVVRAKLEKGSFPDEFSKSLPQSSNSYLSESR